MLLRALVVKVKSSKIRDLTTVRETAKIREFTTIRTILPIAGMMTIRHVIDRESHQQFERSQRSGRSQRE
jgi:predicted transcriptional regulator